MISERFQKQINAHLLGNMLDVENYPLILAIFGTPGMGKTWQLRKYLDNIGIEIFSISSADLESENAGNPAKLLKSKYVNASINIAKKNPSAIVIDDIDTTLGEWEQNTGTVNHQDILAFLMHIADNPYYIEDIGNVNRVPIFFTGNNFNLIYEPLRRPGRMLKFEWEPTDDEKIDIISSYLLHSTDAKKVATDLVNMYPNQPISFFVNLFSVKRLDILSEIASKAMLNMILIDSEYKSHLYQKYVKSNDSIDWSEELLKKEVNTNGENINNY